MNKPVRVRFAPSPTGPLHIGGVRTALFNYLFAKKHKGTFVLRIEDTDQTRYVAGAEDYIVKALNWCGIPFDEGPNKNEKFGPYRQSERKDLYKKYADQLIESGHAYYAFDTAETLDFHRKDHEAKGKTFIYNWHNRQKLDNSLSLSAEAVQQKLDANEDHVVRFKSPQDETLHLTDMIRGDIEIDTNILDDKVLFKSDGMPTYHLANIVDDHLMQISHVIRGEEWVPSLALHYQLYDAFGWDIPQFAHLPLILKPTGKGKLSKRDGDKMGFPVFPLEWTDAETGAVSAGYKENGYFPEAMVNFLALLGWNPGTEQEIFTLEILSNVFELERVNKGGARFDPDKIKWFNHHYMQEQHDADLAKAYKASHKALADIDIQYIELVVALIKERATFVSDFWELSSFFFVAPKDFDDKAYKKAIKDDTPELMTQLIQKVTTNAEFTIESLQEDIKSWITDNNIGFGKVMMPLRLALVGALQGPDVFDIMFMIGKAETVKRIDTLLASI
ncbi:glutamate--tRNA ligase [Subsaximicrobium wynnwilliamsii]|uniref:Glutamate--tRNA ligase n=1 Tax=Subsaximicrobium wynnwilliamsii TaxID=291179 RepID=A0A5C6ZI63_9FLAO|nr:glutamate--tRNA ligase [Subsaximicrobium wynnwilliamsii]TXD82626.1 glutamate--tRNA ligase [Subsaximicrobium wynnwilliamsii]TXD88361.1 glutamate--tRNA ligase [Subsaximicrobium wynnwilliamsii]TXE02288.1 glutamate--tRNA ligase [Subsaximicrobium wynnwilliamsii]